MTLSRIEPMLASPSTSQGGRAPIDIATLTPELWLFQEKFDGVRCQARVERGRVHLTGRNGNDLTRQFPEVVQALGSERSWEVISLDGEITVDGGTLADTLSRVKRTSDYALRQAATTRPASFHAFDILQLGRESVMDWHLDARLHLLGEQLPRWAAPQTSAGQTLLGQVRGQGGEGVIAKRRTSKYVPGTRSMSWIKFKITHTVRAIAYAPSGSSGNGVTLAMIENGKVRDVGSVGAGIDERLRRDLKACLAAGQYPVLLIECLGVSASGRLRQPVVRGRVDEALDAADFAQLAELPVST